ncbi:MAG: EamA family transporter [Firmicutes bacterium]|jgi:transporter family protein|nr:EamA family transporter [Bacillota bacterium]
MWVLFAFGSAIFAGLTAILSKIGVRNTDSNVATAIRTIVVLLFSWLMVFIVGSQRTLADVSSRTLLFLILSGFATGASWLCYFKALQMGDVNKVTPIDKSSTVLTMILAIVLLGEEITLLKAVAMLLIGGGTYLMVHKKKEATSGVTGRALSGTGSEKTSGVTGAGPQSNLWLVYAFGAAIFAALTAILGKVGIEGIESNLGTAIRTVVVLVMAWLIVFMTKKEKTIKEIDQKSWIFLILSGFATGGSWLCYYRALQTGPASVVVPIDKLSIVFTIAFSYFVLKEKLTWKSLSGLVLIVAGTLSLLF